MMNSSYKNMSITPAGYQDDDSDEDFYSSGPARGSSLNFSTEMKIKIVPDVGWKAGLNDTNFDIKMNVNTAVWFDGLKDNFKLYKKGPIISQRLQAFYMMSVRPFHEALQLLANSPEFNLPKQNTLSHTIMEELSNFKRTHVQNVDEMVDNNLRMVAFNFVMKQGQSSLFKLVAATYELSACRDLFIVKVRDMLAAKQYKEAGQIAIDLELFNEFSIDDFVMPLFLQDKISIAEEYLNKAPALQRPVVQLLDSFFDRNDSVENNCSRYIGMHSIPDVYYSKLHFKPLSKLVLRLAKNYNVARELMPNVNKNKSFGALQFLVNKKYFEKSLNKDSWEEMVLETVPRGFPELQVELIHLCSNHCDYAEGARWAKYFDIPIKQLPLLVQDYINDCDGTKQAYKSLNTSVESWDAIEDASKESSHTLTIDDSHIFLVDKKDKFDRMLNDLRRQQMISFDAEWKPTFCATNEVALIQLATRQNIYLIDVILLKIGSEDWGALAKHVFNNDEILKLGFAPATDISMFQKAIPALNIIYNAQTSSSILDLRELWQHITMIRGFRFPFQEDYSNQNLSCLVKLCLGKNLDKSNQLSNWANRPLRKEQLDYAALDAYCLLEIYDVIDGQLMNMNIDSNELLNNLLTENKLKLCDVNKKRYNPNPANVNYNRNEQKKHYQQQQPQHSRHNQNERPRHGNSGNKKHEHGPNFKSVLVSDVKFVCDTMLEGLAKTLRRFGIDTVAVENRENHDKCVFIALREGRYILTRGALYRRFQEFVPKGHCYSVANDRLDDQLLEVLEYYKIVIKLENIFSRCQLCNSSVFLSATQSDVYCLKYDKEMPTSFLLHRHDFMTNENRLKLNRTWTLTPLAKSQKYSKTTQTGAKINAKAITDAVINNIEVFYICDGCGKCYWDGSHLDSILEGNLKNLLNLKYD